MSDNDSTGKSWFEKWGVQCLLTLTLALGGWAGSTLQGVLTAQAVTNSKLEILNKQLADVPGLMQRMATAETKIDRNTNDIHELQQVRKLR